MVWFYNTVVRIGFTRSCDKVDTKKKKYTPGCIALLARVLVRRVVGSRSIQYVMSNIYFNILVF